MFLLNVYGYVVFGFQLTPFAKRVILLDSIAIVKDREWTEQTKTSRVPLMKYSEK